MSDWRDIHADQNFRLAQKMLEQQGEINTLKAERDELKRIATVNGSLHRSAESDVSAAIALVARWQKDVTNLYAANEEEAVSETRKVRAARAAEVERCIWELREALSAPESPKEAE